MGRPRNCPKLLPNKLLAIREFLNLGQVEMATQLQSEIYSQSGRQNQIKPCRIWEYENGHREPNLFVLIAYARLGQVHIETVVDDDVIVETLRERLGNEFCYVTLSRPTNNKHIKPVTLISGTR